jgi:hypothetical protein
MLAFNVTPLLPMVLELMIAGRISDQALTLTAAIYAAGMLACSRQIFLLGLYVLISLLQTAMYGALASSTFDLGMSRYFTIASVGFVFLTQSVERFQIHVLKSRPFWD